MTQEPTPIRILGFAGSLRAASYNRALLRAAQENLPPGMSLETFDLDPIPLYNADVEKVAVPEGVQEFKRRIEAADALLIAVPEYNYSVTGVLKNAIDWASRPAGRSPLDGKPGAILGASATMFGTARAQAHFRAIAQSLDMRLLGRPELMIPKAQEKFDASGRLLDEALVQRLRLLLEGLGAWVRRVKEV